MLFIGAMIFPLGIKLNATTSETSIQERVADTGIAGYVVDKTTREHLPGISISLKGTSFGVLTDNTGHYILKNLQPGTYIIVLQGVGYEKQEREITVQEGHTINFDFEVTEDILNLDEVVVSSNRQATLRKLAPTLVSVIDDKIFKLANATVLSQGLRFQPGIRVETNCQNCGFSQVRINGLDGKYSQILIDSRPIYSALAGIYGLDHIPANMIDRVEVVRGGGSALYGASAVAGIINVITKDPQFNSFNFHNNISLTGGSAIDNSIGFNATVVDQDGTIGGTIFGQNRHRSPWDMNGDGFSEIGKLRSNAFGGRIFLRPTNQDKLTTEGHFVHEYRRGGDHFELPDHAASIAERINHKIYSGNFNYTHFSEDRSMQVQVYGSGQYIERDSYYGGIGDANVGRLGRLDEVKKEFGTNFGVTNGQTYMGGMQFNKEFDELLFMPAKLLLGAEYTYDSLLDKYPINEWIKAKDGDTELEKSGFPPLSQDLHIYSQLAEIEWVNDQFSFLLGTRIDEHTLIRSENGGIKPVLSPRVTLRYNPSKSINLRASYSRGYRAPQVFDEDLHISVVGGKASKIINSKALKPEYSNSFSLSSDMYFNFGAVKTNILLEGFYTNLLGAFTTEEVKDKRKIEGFKTDERINGSNATVYGANIEAKIAYKNLSLQGGLTLQKSTWDEAQEWGLRSLLKGEKVEEAQEIDTNTNHGPQKLDGFETGDEKVSMTTKEFLRTPNVYGYLTLEYRPFKDLSLSSTLNYTGSMFAPHEIEYGREAALKDIELVKSGLRESTVKSNQDAPRWDTLTRTPSFYELGVKASYVFHLMNASKLNLYVGANNLLNAFQKDYDVNGFRNSAYIYGPSLPRTYYIGISLNI